MSVLLIAMVAILFAVVAGAGLWLMARNLPIFTLGDPIEPDGENELDGGKLRAYDAQVQAATGGRGIGALIRRRLILSFAGLVLVLGVIAGTLWLVQR